MRAKLGEKVREWAQCGRALANFVSTNTLWVFGALLHHALSSR
jgi:hypothetical protein